MRAGLGLFGTAGRIVADRIGATLTGWKNKVTSVVAAVVRGLHLVLDVDSLQIRAIGTLAASGPQQGSWAASFPAVRHPRPSRRRAPAAPHGSPQRVAAVLLAGLRNVLGATPETATAPRAAAAPTNGASSTRSSTARSSGAEAKANGGQQDIDWDTLARDVEATDGPKPPGARYPASKTRSTKGR